MGSDLAETPQLLPNIPDSPAALLALLLLPHELLCGQHIPQYGCGVGHLALQHRPQMRLQLPQEIQLGLNTRQKRRETSTTGRRHNNKSASHSASSVKQRDASN